MAHLASAETPTPQVTADRWTAYSVTVWAICMLGFAFDIYEATIMQLVTPLLSELQTREELSALAAISKEIAVDVVRMEYAAGPDELGMKWFDFTASAVDRRWRAGAADMEFALARVAAASPAPGLRILSSPTANE